MRGPDPATLPERDKRDGQPQLEDHPIHAVGDQVEDLPIGRRPALDVLRSKPDQTRALTGEVHRQSGVAGPQQTPVGDELGAADHRYRAVAVLIADQRTAVAAGHGLLADGDERVRQAEIHRSGLIRLSQSAVRCIRR
jgi:hypothetical protein